MFRFVCLFVCLFVCSILFVSLFLSSVLFYKQPFLWANIQTNKYTIKTVVRKKQRNKVVDRKKETDKQIRRKRTNNKRTDERKKEIKVRKRETNARKKQRNKQLRRRKNWRQFCMQKSPHWICAHAHEWHLTSWNWLIGVVTHNCLGDTRRHYETSNEITDDVMINQWNSKLTTIWRWPSVISYVERTVILWFWTFWLY